MLARADSKPDEGVVRSLPFKLSTYTLDGTWLGFEDLTTQLDVCSDLPWGTAGNQPDYLNVGYGIHKECTLNITALIAAGAAPCSLVLSALHLTALCLSAAPSVSALCLTAPLPYCRPAATLAATRLNRKIHFRRRSATLPPRHHTFWLTFWLNFCPLPGSSFWLLNAVTEGAPVHQFYDLYLVDADGTLVSTATKLLNYRENDLSVNVDSNQKEDQIGEKFTSRFMLFDHVSGLESANDEFPRVFRCVFTFKKS